MVAKVPRLELGCRRSGSGVGAVGRASSGAAVDLGPSELCTRQQLRLSRNMPLIDRAAGPGCHSAILCLRYNYRYKKKKKREKFLSLFQRPDLYFNSFSSHFSRSLSSHTFSPFSPSEASVPESRFLIDHSRTISLSTGLASMKAAT